MATLMSLLSYGPRIFRDKMSKLGLKQFKDLMNESCDDSTGDSIAFLLLKIPLRKYEIMSKEVEFDFMMADASTVLTIEDEITYRKNYVSENIQDRIDIFKILLEHPDFDLTQQDYQGHSLLTYLISCGEKFRGSECEKHKECWNRFELLETLCAHPQMKEQIRIEGVTLYFSIHLSALELACLCHYFRAVKLLLDSFPSYYTPEVLSRPSGLPLRYVRGAPGKSLLELVLDYSEVIHCSETHYHKRTDPKVLSETVCSQDSKLISLLIKHGVDYSTPRTNPRHNEYYSVLHQAVHTGSSAVVDALLESAPNLMKLFGTRPTLAPVSPDAPLSVQPVTIVSPIELACHLKGDHADVVEVLLKAGSRISNYEGSFNDRFDCLSIAVLAGNIEVIRYLLTHLRTKTHYEKMKSVRISPQAAIQAQATEFSSSPPSGGTTIHAPLGNLHSVEAAMCDAVRFTQDLRVVKLLHQEGKCDLSSCDGQRSLLLLALENLPILTYFVQNDADPNLNVHYDVSFLSLYGHYIDPMLTCSVLHIAILRGLFESVQILLKSRLIDVNKLDSCGRPPIAMLGAAFDAYSARRYNERQSEMELLLLPSLLTPKNASVRDIEGSSLIMILLLRDRQWHIKLHPVVLNSPKGIAMTSPTLGGPSRKEGGDVKRSALSSAITDFGTATAGGVTSVQLEITTLGLIDRLLDLIEHATDYQPAVALMTQYADGAVSLPWDILMDLWRGVGYVNAYTKDDPYLEEQRDAKMRIITRLSVIARNARLLVKPRPLERKLTQQLRDKEEKAALTSSSPTSARDEDPVAADRLSMYDRLSVSHDPTEVGKRPDKPVPNKPPLEHFDNKLRLSPQMRLIPQCEGTLLKLSDWLKEWRPRYLILYGSCLFICRNAGSNPKTMIDLTNSPAGPHGKQGAGLNLIIERISPTDAHANDGVNRLEGESENYQMPVLKMSSRAIHSRTGYYLLRSTWMGVQRTRQAEVEACEADLIRWVNALAQATSLKSDP